MYTSRHPLALEPISIGDSLRPLLELAGQLENQGNWHLAGEQYINIVQQTPDIKELSEHRAKILARAATCFEIACQARPAARAYHMAGNILSQSNQRPQAAAEMLNRAAILHRSLEEYLSAGSLWLHAASEFAKVQSEIIHTKDNLPPVPLSGFKWAVVGDCYNAAGDAFTQAYGNEMMSCGSYWEAARAQSGSNGLANSHCYNSCLKALTACIRYYKTLEVSELQRCLPLTKEERANDVNPIKVMEEAALWVHAHIEQASQREGQYYNAKLETNRLLVAAFREFSLELGKVGNSREAGQWRISERNCKRQIYWHQNRYGLIFLYDIWKITSGYGELLGRWVTTCALVISIFALVFHYGNFISPNTGWLNAFYISWATFTSFGYYDSAHPVGILGKVISSIEIALGLVMFGVLLSFIGNRFQRA